MNSLRKRAALKAAHFISQKLSLFFAFANCVFHVASGVVSGTLRFIEFALGLHFLVASDFTSSVLYRPFGFVGRPFDVFAVHEFLLRLIELLEEPKKALGRSCGEMRA
jgi:hypothetical protein